MLGQITVPGCTLVLGQIPSSCLTGQVCNCSSCGRQVAMCWRVDNFTLFWPSTHLTLLPLQVSGKLRAAYETDLQAMAPQSVMFPGLHPAAMMSTVGLGSPHTPGAGGQGYRPPGAGPPAYPGPPGGQGQVPLETSFLYIPNAAVGAVIGQPLLMLGA